MAFIPTSISKPPVTPLGLTFYPANSNKIFDVYAASVPGINLSNHAAVNIAYDATAPGYLGFSEQTAPNNGWTYFVDGALGYYMPKDDYLSDAITTDLSLSTTDNHRFTYDSTQVIAGVTWVVFKYYGTV